MSPRFKPAPMEIWVDTREQIPFPFDPAPCRWCPHGLRVVRKTLPTGDYSSRRLARFARCERKAPGDLYGSLVQGRERFDREMVRLAKFRWKFIVVETGLHEFLERGRFGLAEPSAIVQSIASLYARHGIATFFLPNPVTAAEFVAGVFHRCEEELAALRKPLGWHAKRLRRARRPLHSRPLPVWPRGDQETDADGVFLP
jgi:ERCC4-type nuclease